MRPTSLLPLTWALAATAAAQAPESRQVPTFGAEVRAVEVDVVVTRDGRPLAGLAAADFELWDNDVPQTVELLAGPGAPANVVLALDTSASVAGERLQRLKEAAVALLDALGPSDHATLLTFSDEVRLVGGPASDVRPLKAALEGVAAGGATRLHDAIFSSLFLTDRSLGRPIVFVFSDGEDVRSWLPEQSLREIAGSADVAVYAATLVRTIVPDAGGVPYMLDPRGDAARRAEATASVGYQSQQADRTRPEQKTYAPRILGELAGLTGGRVWLADGEQQLRDAFVGVIEEARGRYLLRYTPEGVARGWHELKVRARAKGDVRARRGYSDQETPPR